MDLISMLKREDFFPLFFATVKKYYQEALGWSVSMEFAPSKKQANMVIKPHLSAVTSANMSSKARSFFYAEWNIRNSWMKNIIAKTYVFAMTRTGKQFSQYQFTFSPQNRVSNDVVIAPNNRSIRFFDYEKNIVGCMIKQGFTSKYFDNQLRFRIANHYEFMLPLVAYGADWFQEPILQGHPLVRVTDKKQHEQGIADALADIAVLANDTLHYEDTRQYVSSIAEHIRTLTREAVDRKHIQTSQVIDRIVDDFLAEELALTRIPVCQSHGDFQGGNIWVDTAGKTWLYDWETVGQRSVWYDASVLLYSLRRDYGWGEFKAEKEPIRILNCDPQKQYAQKEFDYIKKIILLEDIVFYLEDMLELPSDWGNELFDAFAERIQSLTYNS